MADFFGMVKRDAGGLLHLVAGRSDTALCGVRRRGEAWEVTMKGIVNVDYVRHAPSVCADCVSKALDG